MNETSYFFIPFCFSSTIREYTQAVAENPGWEKCSAEDLRTDYLLRYACRLSQNPDTYVRFIRNDLKDLSFYHCQNFPDPQKELYTDSTIHFSEIAVSVFGTGIGFLEVCIEYQGLDYDEICEFIYQFKKIYKAESGISFYHYDCISLMQFMKQALPDETVPFFYINEASDFKKECLGYHFFKNETQMDPDVFSHLMYCLGRGYRTSYVEGGDDSSYDMLYHTSAEDCWSGSQEGLAYFTFITEKNSYFVNNLQPGQLRNDFRFMYLLLLNQRFSALRYIEMISEIVDSSKKQASPKNAKQLAHKIEQLKSIYSYRVISNDRVYQNVYSKMYDLYNIDLLIEDMNDYLAQMRTSYSEKADQNNSRLNRAVFILSILTIFSGLVDFASYLEKFDLAQSISRTVSLVIVLIILVLMIFIYRKK